MENPGTASTALGRSSIRRVLTLALGWPRRARPPKIGALAGYEQLGGASRMHGLGPAFGTKFLFFQNREALILDDLLATRWFRGVTGVNLRPTVWNTNLYETYLTAMHDWAADANVEPASIEQAAFQLVSDGRGNQWAR